MAVTEDGHRCNLHMQYEGIAKSWPILIGSASRLEMLSSSMSPAASALLQEQETGNACLRLHRGISKLDYEMLRRRPDMM